MIANSLQYSQYYEAYSPGQRALAFSLWHLRNKMSPDRFRMAVTRQVRRQASHPWQGVEPGCGKSSRVASLGTAALPSWAVCIRKWPALPLREGLI